MQTMLPFLEPGHLRSADGLPIRNTSATLLDLERVAEHITEARRRDRYQGPTDPLAYLRQSQCLIAVDGEEYVSLAGLLCFGRDPQALFPNAVIDLGHYRGADASSYDLIHLEKNIGGTVFEQLQRMEQYLWQNTHHGMTLGDGLQRIEVHQYPRAVIRELGVNMLAHRDYMLQGTSARVLLFRDRIEWISPGGLPPGVTVENVLRQQMARNPILLSILYQAGYVEAFGQGLDTVVIVLRNEGMESPRFEDIGAAFIVTVAGRAMEQLQALGAMAQLTPNQRRIVNLLMTKGDAALREFRELFGDRTVRTIQRDLEGLIEAQLVEPVGEGRGRRYRLITSGRR